MGISTQFENMVGCYCGGQNFLNQGLVDTGAEVNIIKREIIPQEYLQKDSNPLVLRGAKETKLKGETYAFEGWGC